MFMGERNPDWKYWMGCKMKKLFLIYVICLIHLFSLTSNCLSISITNLDSLSLNGYSSSYYLNSSNQNSGTLPNGRLSGEYSNITSIGTLSSLRVMGDIYSTGNISSFGRILTNPNSGTTGVNRGIDFFGNTSVWGQYVATTGSNKSFSNGTLSAFGSINSYAMRFCANNSAANGFIFENNSEVNLFGIRGSDGQVYMTGFCGINTTSPQGQLSVVGDIRCTGNIYESNSAYGEYYASGNVTATVIASSTTLYDVTKNMTSGALKNMTHSNGVLTATVAGTYMIMATGYVGSKTASDDLHIWISKNNATVNSGANMADCADTTDTAFPFSCQGIFTLAVNDTIRLKVRNTTAARNATFEMVSVIARRIAP